MNVIDKLSEIFQNPNLVKNTAEGKRLPVFGNFCNYIPEEIIHAAGILPFRITHGLDSSSSNEYISPNICPMIRSFFGSEKEGEFNFLDGLIGIHSCVPFRRLFDLWANDKDSKLKFSHILNLPHKKEPRHVLEYFKNEITKLKIKIEEFIGKSITEESLKKSIKVYNENRHLLRKIYEYKKKTECKLTGSETLGIIGSSTVMLKEENNKLLNQVIDLLNSRQEIYEGKRVLISGSTLDKPDLFQLIENSGGVVAADDLCIGTRYFFDQIDESISDPIEAIAKRYLELIPCSRMFDFHEERIDHAVKLITDYDIQGLIYVVLKYCDDFMIDYPLYKEKMDELGIPILYLEREYILDNVEALRTRIEAFIELIGGK